MKSIYSGSGMLPFISAVVAFEKDLWRRRQRVVRIMGVDPGVITGVCVLWMDPDTGELVGWGETLITHDETKQVFQLMALLRTLADLGRVWIAVEDFRVQMVNMDPDFLSPVRVGRKFEMAAELMATGELGEGPVFGSIELPVAWQSRSRKADYDDERLRKMGMYTEGPDHRRDATRHALVRWKQLKLELPFTVKTDPAKFWEPGLEAVELKQKVSRSFNGVATAAHGQPGKKGVTKEDMQRLKMSKIMVGGHQNGKWTAMAEQMIAYAKTGAKVGLTGENVNMPLDLQKKVAAETGLQWVPLPNGTGWVLEHDPKVSSGLVPMQPKAVSPDVPKPSPKAKKRKIRRIA